MSKDLHPWAAALDTLLDEVWTRLIRGVHDRRAAARHPTLATVGVDGSPQVRTVVLRGADRSAARLRVYTDLRSAKVAELRAVPQAALHIWDSGAHLQIRLSAQVTIQTGAVVAPLWDALSQGARMSYGGTPPPGQPVSEALAYHKTPDPAAFAVLQLDLLAMDILHLGRVHRRARFDRAKGWAGTWCAP